MTIKCASCGRSFESLIIDPEIAWREVYTKLLKHVVDKHPQDNARVQKLMVEANLVLAGIVSVNELIEIPEPVHPWLASHLEGMGDKIMDILGFVDDDEDESEEDSEQLDSNKDLTEPPTAEVKDGAELSNHSDSVDSTAVLPTNR